MCEVLDRDRRRSAVRHQKNCLIRRLGTARSAEVPNPSPRLLLLLLQRPCFPGYRGDNNAKKGIAVLDAYVMLPAVAVPQHGRGRRNAIVDGLAELLAQGAGGEVQRAAVRKRLRPQLLRSKGSFGALEPSGPPHCPFAPARNGSVMNVSLRHKGGAAEAGGRAEQQPTQKNAAVAHRGWPSCSTSSRRWSPPGRAPLQPAPPPPRGSRQSPLPSRRSAAAPT